MKKTTILFAFMLAFAWQVQGMTGDGIVSNPYLISTYDDLKLVKNNLTAHYRLANDIDASASAAENEGAGFEPVGNFNLSDVSLSTPFTGTFHGGGYVIQNLSIKRSSQNFVGLFGYLGQESIVDSLGLTGADIRGGSYVGAIAGISNGSIENCYSIGSVTGTSNYIGGIVGDNYTYGRIVSCYSGCSVKGTSSVGGLVGYNIKNITKSHAAGAVTGSGDNIGGLVGINNTGGTVSFSYATGSVNSSGDNSKDNFGGLAGRNAGHVLNCYASGNVNGGAWTTSVGGLVGNNTNGTANYCYSIGKVSGWRLLGGLVENEIGAASGTVNYSYWNTATSEQSLSEGGTGRSATQMVKQSTFVNWNFSTIWAINEEISYPYLKENVPDIIPAPPVLTIEGTFSANDKIYDGTTAASISAAGLTLKGIASGDAVTLNAVAAFADADLGKNKPVNLYNSTLTGGKGGKYIISFVGAPTTLASIKRGLTIGGSFSVSSKQYDGNVSAVISINELTLTGVVEGDQVALTPIAAFTDADAGENKTVKLTEASSISGSNDDDYILSLTNAPTTTGTIEKADIPTPGAPEVFEKDTKSITLFSDGLLQFSIDNGNSWQDEDVFDGLTAATAYNIVARIKETANYKASPMTEVLQVITDMNGSGTADDPYLISSYTALKIVKEKLSAHYRLACNIDASASEAENEGAGFEPIGNEVFMQFDGNFHGGGYIISNLNVNRTITGGPAGLFGYIDNYAVIDSLGLLNVVVSGGDRTGGLAGVNQGVISRSYVTGEVEGTGYTGGLVGVNYRTIVESYAAAFVYGNNISGGLLGCNDGGSIADSYASGDVYSNVSGGLAGENRNGYITNCYAVGKVYGTSGENGLIGFGNEVNVTASYWNTETSGQANPAGGTGATIAAMRQQTLFTDWDFANKWAIIENKTYPGLRGLNNAPFAFDDEITSPGTFALSDLLLNVYDIETGTANLVLKVLSHSLGSVSDGILTFPSESVDGTSCTVVYRVGETLGTDTLWGNWAMAEITYRLGTGTAVSAGWKAINIYPNPVNETFFIKGIDDKSIIRIIDMSGRLVILKQVSSEDAIDVSWLNPGIYLIDVGGIKMKLVKK